MAANCRQMCHTYGARFAFIDERQTREPGLVAGEHCAHFIEKTAINLIHDFEMPRHQCAEKVSRPFLQRLWQQSVISVGEACARDRPSFVPSKSMFVHEQSH